MGSARGNWDPREGQQPFRPNPNGAGDRTTTLRRLLIGAVWSRICNLSPKCVKLKCICHSLALCVQKSFEKLPLNLGFLLTEIPSWFKKSTVRRMQFKSLFQLMNDEDESAENVLFPKLSQTRWLVRSKLMFNRLLN